MFDFTKKQSVIDFAENINGEITIEYDTPCIAKTDKHVLDVSMIIKFGEI